MDSLSFFVLSIIPYAITYDICGASVSRSTNWTKPQPEREPRYMPSYFGPPCQEPIDLVPLSKDVPSYTAYALPPPITTKAELVEAGKRLVKDLREHLPLERLHLAVLELNRAANGDFTAEVLIYRLSALLADKPALLRSLEFLTPGHDLLVTVHARRTYLTLWLCRSHAISWALDPSKVCNPPTPPIPTIVSSASASTPSQIQRVPCPHHGGPSNPGTPALTSAPTPPAPSSVTILSAPQRRTVVIADPAKRISLSRAFCTALATRLAHKPPVRAELFRLLAAAGPFGPYTPASSTPNTHTHRNTHAGANANTSTNTNKKEGIRGESELASAAFAGLAFGALRRPADVRRAGALLLDAPDLLRALADFVDGDEARAELARVVGLADVHAARVRGATAPPR